MKKEINYLKTSDLATRHFIKDFNLFIKQCYCIIV